MRVLYLFVFVLIFVIFARSQYLGAGPDSTTVYEGQTAYFYVQVFWGGVTAKWFMNNKELPHETNTMINIIATREMQNAKFHAVVNFPDGHVATTQPAYLTVLYKPELIRKNSYSARITPGQSPPPFSVDSAEITLPVFAGHVWSINLTEYFDGANLNWEWRQDGQAISLPNSLIKVDKGYIKSTVMPTDIETSYLLHVSNPGGIVTGPRILLALAPPPQLNPNFPDNSIVFANEYLEINANYIDDGFTLFQWQLDDISIPNQQRDSIRFKIIDEMNGAKLTLTANNPAGTTRLSTILTVLLPRWAIALIVILTTSFAATIVLFFLHKRGFLAKLAQVKFTKLTEVNQIIDESTDREEHVRLEPQD
jgi:hypothetical protein